MGRIVFFMLVYMAMVLGSVGYFYNYHPEETYAYLELIARNPHF